MSQPTNSTILSEDLTSYPPSLHDLTLETLSTPEPPFSPLSNLARILNPLEALPSGVDNAGELSSLYVAVQRDERLLSHNTTPDSGFHDVYLLSTPHRSVMFSAKHWSVYCQGSIYHLRLQGRRDPQLSIERLSVEDMQAEMEGVREEVEAGTFHHATRGGGSDEDEMRKKRNLPLVAYCMGQTRFGTDQIDNLARYVIGKIGTYTLFEKNCHMFALSLVHRCVMTKHDGSVFVGTRAQLMQWDERVKYHPGKEMPFCWAHGYVVSDLGRDVSKFEYEYWKLADRFADGAIVESALAVGVLYRSGPLATGSFDPTGAEKSQAAHGSSVSKTTMKADAKGIAKSIKEAAMDVRSGDFKSAWRGRDDSRLESYRQLLGKASLGDKRTRDSLAFHRKSLSITREEERGMLEGMGMGYQADGDVGMLFRYWTDS